ncbi:response regulator [Leptolyngbya cf. ectocarpi LEGE 11479]|uniref:Response regulator n=1 Tax=Leptolyngbya cf. ectocarpi LEGE 11479 TaxID=1828722 RepID=A0A928ZVE0_LEPEC|nr:response regulator [Leptolyngbya ectocarpi]MBE9068133.1 response regulator [Leptolyngbya cf. ectocarpi LEGE 11479]
MSASKVMVVEDESIISLHLKTTLLRLGYSVSGVAASGDAALRKIKVSRPDLILMDIHLKGDMTGIEVSEKIKSDFQIPIIYLTANADSLTFQEAKQTDPYSYIIKPFEEKELGIAIEIALHQHQKEQTTRSTEAWYTFAFKALQAAVIATDPDGYVVFMNAYAEMITGWTFTDAFNRPIAEIFKFKEKHQRSSDVEQNIGPILMDLLNGKSFVPLPEGIQLLPRPGTAIPLTGTLPASETLIPIEGNAATIKDSIGDILGNIFIFRRLQASLPYRSHGQPPAPAQQRVIHQANSQGSSQTTDEEADDIALIQAFIQAFIQGESILLSTPRLIAEAHAGSTTLTAKSEGIIVNVKSIDNNKLTAAVKRDSPYWEMICQVFINFSFFPVGQRTNGTCYFQYRAIPEQCQVYCTTAMNLWDAWRGRGDRDGCDRTNKSVRTSPQPPRSNILVLRRGSWYHIQRMAFNEGRLHVRTIGGEIFIQPEESLIWGAHIL